MGEFSPSKLAQNTLKFTFKLTPTKSNNGISFLALLISILIYISIFNYLFELSPRVLFNTTKFWFLISNTLVIIIAADSGAFSSSEYKNVDPQDELVVTNYSFRDFKPPRKYNIGGVQEKGKHRALNDPHGSIIHANKCEEAREASAETSVQGHSLSRDLGDESFEDKEMIEVRHSCEEGVVDREKPRGEDYENDKFSSMTNEELNERVEEFIRRFYDQQLKPQLLKPQPRRLVNVW